MLELKHITKRFQERVILEDLSYTFQDTGFVGIQGTSGCGKSTLLYIIGMLDDCFEGEVFYNQEKIVDRKLFIKEHISYMMQNKDIISSLTVRENILLSSMVSQHHYAQGHFKKIVTQLEISELLDTYPDCLSGGQLKRVSIAKALLKQSSVLLCDEPTGALHQKQAQDVMKLLKKLSEEILVIVVSHDRKLLKETCDDVLTLKQGKLVGRTKKKEKKELPRIKKHHYFLWFYTIRQIIYQRNKLIFLFVFQWLLIVAFFLVVTAMSGMKETLNASETKSVNANMIQIEKRNGGPFKTLDMGISAYSIDYHYHLDRIVLKSNQQDLLASLTFLPLQTSFIELKQGTFPLSKYEVIVSEMLYNDLINKESLSLSIQDHDIEMKIVGVVKSYLFQGRDVYCSKQLKDDLLPYKDEYSLSIESYPNQSRNLYKQVNETYRTYSDVIERIDNYQSLLSLANMVAYVFIGISFIISMILIAIVESIIYFERKHDVGYLLSLGLSRRRLFMMSMLESMILGILMAMGGCVLSKGIYYYLNDVYSLYQHFSFELVLKPILFSKSDLYIFIFISYMLMTMLGALSSILKMMKTNMIDVLREE